MTNAPPNLTPDETFEYLRACRQIANKYAIIPPPDATFTRDTLQDLSDTRGRLEQCQRTIQSRTREMEFLESALAEFH